MIPTDSKTTGAPSDALERALRAGLRPVDPGAAFTAALRSRLALSHPRREVAADAPQGVADRAPAARDRRLHSASLALAASIVVALGIGAQLMELRADQSAAQARLEQAQLHAQVLLALEITSERLGLAQQRIEQFQVQEKIQ